MCEINFQAWWRTVPGGVPGFSGQLPGAPGGSPEAPEGKSGRNSSKSVTKLTLASVRPPPGGHPETSAAHAASLFTSVDTEKLNRETQEAHLKPYMTLFDASFRRQTAPGEGPPGPPRAATAG